MERKGVPNVLYNECTLTCQKQHSCSGVMHMLPKHSGADGLCHFESPVFMINLVIKLSHTHFGTVTLFHTHSGGQYDIIVSLWGAHAVIDARIHGKDTSVFNQNITGCLMKDHLVEHINYLANDLIIFLLGCVRVGRRLWKTWQEYCIIR